MSIFSKLGKPEKAIVRSRKPKTAKELLLAGIERQRKIEQGEKVSGTGGSEARRWFNKELRQFKPFIGIYSLMGESAWPYKPGDELEILDIFKASVKGDELDEYINQVQASMDKRGKGARGEK